jgi:hypothetical protein
VETNATDAKCESARRDAKGSPSVAYTPRPYASPEGEFTALANVYRFLLDRRERSDVAAADGAEKDAEHVTLGYRSVGPWPACSPRGRR